MRSIKSESFIENVLFTFTDIELWENYGGQKSIKDRNYGSVDIFMRSTFTLGTMLTTVYLLWIQGNSQIALLIAAISLVVFVLLFNFMSRYILYFKK